MTNTGNGGPIAIVGMAGLYPQSPDKDAFWRNILDARDCVTDAPEDWCGDLFLDPYSAANDRVYTTKGGFLGELARFNPLRHGVMPSSVDGGEPDQFLALELAADALEDADFDARPVDGDRVAVILGRGTYINRGFTSVVQHGIMIDRFLDILKKLHPDTEAEELTDVKAQLKASLPPFNAEIAPALVPNLVTGRISNRLDFRGANYIIDAACASSLIALDRGVADLRAGRCDMAMVGGVHASTPAPIYQIFCQLEALSRKGQIRPFSDGADGTLLAEGVGILCLKRLEDAEAAGDRIYALVRGVGVASDGRATGILAPRIEGEQLALSRAYEDAGVDPATVGLIEAHGTATTVGDATEIEALAGQFGASGKARRACALGTVKSNIGHCLPASGSAGLIKAALALHHKVLPPTLMDAPNPELGIEDTPLYLNTEARPWVHGAETPRRAGVNAFGFGGINAHAVLEEYTGPQAAPVMTRESEMLALDGADADALLARIATARAALADAPLAQVFAAMNAELGDGPFRAAIVAAEKGDAEDRLAKIEAAMAKGKTKLNDRRGSYFTADPAGPKGKVAFMFPGEGSQHVGMLREVMLHYPAMRAWFDLVDGAFAGQSRDVLPSQVIFPPGDEDGGLWRMDIGPEAIFAANQAVAELYAQLGLGFDMLVGHSTGEYSALYAAGVTRRDDPRQLQAEIRELNVAYQDLSQSGVISGGTLVAVGAVDGDALSEKIDGHDDLFLAMDNCPNQKVVAALGDAGAQAVEDAVSALGGFAERLPFERAYHSPAFAGFSDGLARHMEKYAFNPPECPVYSCVSTTPFPDGEDDIRALTVGQWAARVRFAETIQQMHDDGARVFIECGPRNNLSAFVNDILRGQDHVALAVDTPGRAGLLQLHHFASRLAVEGVPFDLAAIAAPEVQEKPLTGQPLKMGIQPMQLTDVPERRTKPKETPPPAAPPSPAKTALSAYFDTMEQFVAAETQIMQAYLGAKAQPAPQAPMPVSAGPVSEGRFPLLASVAPAADGNSLTAQIRFDLQDAPFLKDHCFGRDISRLDPSLAGVSVVPLTFSMEVLAEAAAALRPDMVVCAMREVRASRWLVVGPGGLALDAVAEVTAENEITVRLREAGEGLRPVLVEAVVEMGTARAPAPAAPKLAESQPTGVPWTQADVYDRIMFHGPSLHAVKSMDHASDTAAEGDLIGVDQGALLAREQTPEWELDPVTLDAVGQLVGVWSAEMLPEAFHIFPFRAERLDVYRPPLSQGEIARCRCRVERPGDDDLRSYIDVVCNDGHLQCRIEGWWDKRFDLPQRFFEARLDPAAGFTSRPLNSQTPGLQIMAVDELTGDFLDGSGGIWGRVLAGLALSQAERTVWNGMGNSTASRRWDWLRGRVAAKDAVRALAAPGFCTADIEISGSGEDGAPVVDGAWARDQAAPPHISISHSGGIALAAAADATGFAGVGVDIEVIAPRPDSFLQTAFDAAECAYLAGFAEGADRDGAATRLWCAKEAAAKSYGLGIEAFDRFKLTLDGDLAGRVSVMDAETETILTVDFLTGLDATYVAAIALRRYDVNNQRTTSVS